jgi:hypothetical protein
MGTLFEINGTQYTNEQDAARDLLQRASHKERVTINHAPVCLIPAEMRERWHSCAEFAELERVLARMEGEAADRELAGYVLERRAGLRLL